jgi:excisionase family DNA binding protein
MSDDRLLAVATVAYRLQVTPETVRSWIRSGKLDAIRTPTGRYRVPASTLTALLRRKTQDSQTPDQ